MAIYFHSEFLPSFCELSGSDDIDPMHKRVRTTDQNKKFRPEEHKTNNQTGFLFEIPISVNLTRPIRYTISGIHTL